jgi:rubredoxin
MVGMLGRTVSFPNVSVGDAVYPYFLFHRAKYKHLYLCKNCTLNFETQKPARECTRCHQSEFIELYPKDFLKSDYGEWLADLRSKFVKTSIYTTPKKYSLPKLPKITLKKPDIRIDKIRWHADKEELPTK